LGYLVHARCTCKLIPYIRITTPKLIITQIPTLPIILYLTSLLPYPIVPGPKNTTFHTHTFTSILLLLCLAASRLGRGIFSLTTQQLSQSQVVSSQRSSFGGTEQIFVSIFGLSHNIGSAIFNEPQEFGWLALGSIITICASVLIFVWWIYMENIGIGRWEFWSKTIGYEAVGSRRIEEDVDEQNYYN
jgi:iron-regulated transporter 1